MRRAYHDQPMHRRHITKVLEVKDTYIAAADDKLTRKMTGGSLFYDKTMLKDPFPIVEIVRRCKIEEIPLASLNKFALPQRTPVASSSRLDSSTMAESSGQNSTVTTAGSTSILTDPAPTAQLSTTNPALTAPAPMVPRPVQQVASTEKELDELRRQLVHLEAKRDQELRQQIVQLEAKRDQERDELRQQIVHLKAERDALMRFEVAHEVDGLRRERLEHKWADEKRRHVSQAVQDIIAALPAPVATASTVDAIVSGVRDILAAPSTIDAIISGVRNSLAAPPTVEAIVSGVQGVLSLPPTVEPIVHGVRGVLSTPPTVGAIVGGKATEMDVDEEAEERFNP